MSFETTAGVCHHLRERRPTTGQWLRTYSFGCLREPVGSGCVCGKPVRRANPVGGSLNFHAAGQARRGVCGHATGAIPWAVTVAGGGVAPTLCAVVRRDNGRAAT